MKHNNIPIFIPELACPHQCIFCNQSKISGVQNIPKPEEIENIVEKYLTTIPSENHVEIAFFGGSFTGIPYEIQEKYLKEAFKFVADKRVKGIRLSTRPDYISAEILDLLKKYEVTTIELGAQSTDDEVLQQSGRGHTFQDIVNASELINSYNFELGLQMMIGLPGDNFEKSLKTAIDIIELKAKNTRIYPTLVVKDTNLEKLYIQGKYQPLTLEEAVFQSKEIYRLFEKNHVNVIRVGLHPTEEFNSGEFLIAGPYHKSFKELVLTEIWFDLLSALNLHKSEKEYKISINKTQLNFAVGYYRKNLKYFYNQGINMKFIANENLNNYEILCSQ